MLVEPAPAPGEPRGGPLRTERGGLEPLDLGSILLRTTELTEEQLAEARAEQATRGGRLADLLVESGKVSSDEVLQALATQLGLPIRPQIAAGVVDQTLIETVPIGFAKAHVILPLQRDPDGAVRVAVANPLDIGPLDDLRILFGGAEVRLELANQRTILGAINEVYDRGLNSTDALAEDAAEDLTTPVNDISHEPQDPLEASTTSTRWSTVLQHAVTPATHLSRSSVRSGSAPHRRALRIEAASARLVASIVSRIKSWAG